MTRILNFWAKSVLFHHMPVWSTFLRGQSTFRAYYHLFCRLHKIMSNPDHSRCIVAQKSILTIYCSLIPSFDAEGCEGGALGQRSSVVGEAEAELCTPLSTQQVPGPGCTAHWTQCIDHTNTQPPPRERELSPLPGCSSLLPSVEEMWRWRRHLVRARPPTSDTPQPQPHPHCLFHSGSHQPHDISWAEH